MNHPVISALFPVVLFIAIGWIAGQRRWVGPGAIRDLSNLVFMVLAPALLFRTMGTVRVEQLDFRPVAVYFMAAGLIFAATLLVKGFNRRGAVLALANTFSNTLMIGVPLVGLAYGPAGLVTLFTLISLHSLVLLTLATVVLELAVARENAYSASGQQGPDAAAAPLRNAGPNRPALWFVVGKAVRNAVIHPIPLPILAGLLFAQTGWVLPAMVDKPLLLLGQALAPVALILVGVILVSTPVGQQIRSATQLALVKNMVHPALVVALGWALGLQGPALGVMVLAAALPIGANVFLFSQRYQVAQDIVTAGVAVSTILALVTLPVAMAVAARI